MILTHCKELSSSNLVHMDGSQFSSHSVILLMLFNSVTKIILFVSFKAQRLHVLLQQPFIAKRSKEQGEEKKQ